MPVIRKDCFNSAGLSAIADSNFLGKLFSTAIPDGRTLPKLSPVNLPSARFMGYQAAAKILPGLSTNTPSHVHDIRFSSLTTCLQRGVHLKKPDFDSDLQASLKKAAETLSESWCALAENALIGFGPSSPSMSGHNAVRRDSADGIVRGGQFLKIREPVT